MSIVRIVRLASLFERLASPRFLNYYEGIEYR